MKFIVLSLFIVTVLSSNLVFATSRFSKDNVFFINAVESAFVNSDEWHLKQQDYQNSHETSVSVNSAWKPTVSASVFINKNSQGGSKYTSRGGKAQLTQPIYAGGAIASGIKFAKTNEKLALLQNAIDQETIILNAFGVSSQVIIAKKNISIYLESLKRLRTVFKITKIKYKNGLVSKADYLLSLSQYKSAKTDYKNAKDQLVNAQNDYQTLTGKTYKANTLSIKSLAFNFPFPAKLKRLKIQVLSDNLQLLYDKTNILLQHNVSRISKSRYYPQVNMVLSGQRAKYIGALYSSKKYINDFSAGVELSIPIYTSGLNRSNYVKQLTVEKKAAIKFSLDRKNIIQNTTKIFALLKVDKDKIVTDRQTVRARKLIYERYKVQYTRGTASITDLIRSQNDLSNAQLTQLQDQVNYYKNQFIVFSYIGKLKANFFGVTTDLGISDFNI